MRLRLTLAAFMGCCAISCNNNDPKPEDLVTYTLEFNQDVWLFASDVNGRLLDSKKLVYKEPVTLRATNPGESFSLTLVRRPNSNVAAFALVTYTGITPGTEFAPQIYDPVDAVQPSATGKSTFEIVNYPQDQDLPLIISDPWQSTTYSSSGWSSPTFAMSVWDSKQPPVMFSGYMNDLAHPVYKFIDAIDANETLSSDFATFKPFDHTFDLKGYNTTDGKVTFQLYGYSEDKPSNGYKLANLEWYYNGTSPLAKIGYVDQFDEYYMIFWAYQIDRQLNRLKKSLKYTSVGAKPGPIKLLDDQLTVSNTTMNNFDFTFSGEYHMRSHYFSYGTHKSAFTWVIYSGPGASSIIKEIPQELSELSSDFQAEFMEYSSSSFYTFDDGFDYKKILNERFTTSFGPDHPCYVQTFPK